jgi:hypothetical protein
MVHLENLDASIARLDRALERADGLPDDPVAAHELAFCLAGFVAQELPSGLGTELDELLWRAIAVARQLGPAPFEAPVRAPFFMTAAVPAGESTGQLRSALLDIAAAISVLRRE